MKKLNGTQKTALRLGKVDIKLGRPLPWHVYDEDGTLLYAQGALIFSQKKLTELLEIGLYRKIRNIPPDLEKIKAEEEKDRKAQARQHIQDNRPLDKVPVSVGDIVQLQALNENKDSERLTARLIGFVPGRSVMITTPVKDKKYVPLKDGQSYVVRLFCGRNVYAFVAHVLRQSNIHCSYVHFSYPTVVQGVKMRSGIRARVNIIGYVRTAEGEDAAARVQDLSAGGCRLVGKEFLGEVGAEILIKIRVRTDGLDEFINIKAIIRSFGLTEDEEWVTHGVQFIDMDPDHKFALIAFVYRFLLLEEESAQQAEVAAIVAAGQRPVS